MRRPLLVMTFAMVAAVAVVGCGGDGQPGVDGGGAVGDLAFISTGNPEVDRWLTAHNGVRAGAMPAPSPALAPLTWSDAAAQVAAGWAANCMFQHNGGRGSFGENIYADSGRMTGPSDVVSSWASEAANYDYATNRCAAGKSCGHYTQIVWRATTAVGCAIQSCTANCPFGSCIGGKWNLVVCDYSPPGNSGGKPY